MLRGDFGVVVTHSRVGLGIRVATLSRYNHAVIAVSPTELVEANPDGVDRKPIAEYTDSDIVWSRYQLTAWQREKAAGFAESKLHDRYNYPGICALAFDHFLGWRPRKLDDEANQPDTWFCSQLVVAAYRAAGLDLAPGKPDWTVSPGDLADVVLKRTSL